jgi:hypothetical protein
MHPRAVAVAAVGSDHALAVPAEVEAGAGGGDVPRWEYVTHHVTSLSMRAIESNLPMDEHLNRMGGDGWELVSVVLRRSVTSREEEFMLFFKRPAAPGRRP